MSKNKHRALVVALGLATGAVMVGCAQESTGTEQGTGTEQQETLTPPGERQADEPAYDGPYDSEFYNALDAYEGEEVTVTGEVAQILSPTAFTMAGAQDTEVGPLLIVSLQATGGLEDGMTVSVAGTVHEALDLAAVEERFKTELDDDLLRPWNGGPYLEAVIIELPT